jgi:hypothetical protein
MLLNNWSTFTLKEATKLGIVANENAEELTINRFGKSGY